MNHLTNRNTKNGFQYAQLESRQVLTAFFSFDPNLMELGMNLTGDSDVSISQNEESFFFELEQDVWVGEDRDYLSGDGTSLLEVDREMLENGPGGILLAASTQHQIDLLFEGDVDFGEIDSRFMIDGVNEISQTDDSTVALNQVYVDVNNFFLPNSGNQFSSFSFFEADEVAIGSASPVEFTNVLIGSGTFVSEGAISMYGSVIANELNVRSNEDVMIQTGYRFHVNKLEVAGKNIIVRAHTTAQSDDSEVGPYLSILRQLNFQSEGLVIIETSDLSSSFTSTRLFGENTAGELQLRIKGRLLSRPTTDLLVEGDARLHAVQYLRLGHFETNDIIVGGQADLSSYNWTDEFGEVFLGSVSIGEGGNVNFGSILLDKGGTYFTIHEDGSSRLDGVTPRSGKNVNINSSGGIFDATDAIIDGFRVRLNSDQMVVLGETEGSHVQSPFLIMEAPEIHVGGAGNVQISNVNFKSDGIVRIFEDDSTYLVGDNTAGSLVLNSKGSVLSGPSATVNVQQGMSVRSTERIVLGNGSFVYVGGLAKFEARISVIIGKNGTASFEQLTFQTDGTAFINETGRMHLVGQNYANHMILRSTAYISDGPEMTLAVFQYAELKTPKGVLLADNADNLLEFCGNVYFNVDEFVVIDELGEVAINMWSVKNGTFHSLNIDTVCSVDE